MKQFLRDYFTFNRRERNGVFILLSIILLLILYLFLSDYFYNHFSIENKIDFSKFEKEISIFEAEQKRSSDSAEQFTRNYFSGGNIPEPEEIERFNFNPNNLPEKDWKRLGLSDKQIRIIKNYENKGGQFRTKEDLKKMYCISGELYASLEPYIQIPEKEKLSFSPFLKGGLRGISVVNTQHLTSDFKHLTAVIELNSADTTELKQLKGIGSVFAKRIVKYRDALGGFVKKEQLMEVYGFDQEKFDLISSQITLDSLSVKKININTASVETLRKHPYIDKKTAVKIFMHRVNDGDYSDLQEIKKLNFAEEQLFNKIAPYLTVK